MIRKAISRALVGAASLFVSETCRATDAMWLTATSGSWTDATMWSTNPNFPNNGSPAGTTYDARIAAVGSDYTVSLESSVTVDSLSIDSPNAKLSLGGIVAPGTLDTPVITINSGTLYLREGTIKNSVLQGAGSIDFSFGIFSNVTLQRDLRLEYDFATLRVEDELNLANRTVTLVAGARITSSINPGLEMIDGTGTIVVERRTQSSGPISSIGGVILGPNITLRGGPTVPSGGGRIAFVGENRGRIVVDTMSVDLGGNWLNNGSIELFNNQRLTMGGTFSAASLGTIHRTGGEIRVTGTVDASSQSFVLNASLGDVVLEDPALLRNGRFETRDSTKFMLLIDSRVRLENVTLAGRLETAFRGRVELRSDLTLDSGVLSLGPEALLYSFGTSAQTHTIGGTGVIAFDSFGNPARINAPDGSPRRVLGAGIVVTNGDNHGEIWSFGNGSFTSFGTISARNGKRIEIDGNNRNFDNRGAVEARNFGSISIVNSAAVANYNAGVLIGGTWAAYNGFINFGGASITTNAASVRLDGGFSTFTAINTLNDNRGTFALSGGRDFTTAGSLANSGSILLGVGSELTVAGTYSPTPTSLLSIELGPGALESAASGRLVLSNQTSLAGSLALVLATDYMPSYGDSFVLLSGVGISGVFSSVLAPALPGGLEFVVAYDSSGVTTQVIPEPTMALIGLTALLALRRRRTP